MSNHLIVGDSGQDGQILTRLLRSKGTSFVGINSKRVVDSRKSQIFEYSDITDIAKILDSYTFDKVYFLASRNFPANISYISKETENRIGRELELLDLILNLLSKDNSFENRWVFFASSALIFGHPLEVPQNETTRINPMECYAEIKVKGMEKCKSFSDATNIPVCTAILYPHESEYRNPSFLFSKIIKAATEGLPINIHNPDYKREWNDAVEVAQVIRELEKIEFSGDICVGSGIQASVEEVASYIFEKTSRKLADYLIYDTQLPTIRSDKLVCDNSLLKSVIGKVPSGNFREIVDRCVSIRVDKCDE